MFLDQVEHAMYIICVVGSAERANVTDPHAEPAGLLQIRYELPDGPIHATRNQTGKYNCTCLMSWIG